MAAKRTFEQALGRLDEIVAALDGGEETLDGSLKLFGEGAELLAFCSKELEQARLKVETLFPQEEDVDD